MWLVMDIMTQKEINTSFKDKNEKHTSIDKIDGKGVASLVKFQRMKHFEKGFNKIFTDEEMSASGKNSMYTRTSYMNDLLKSKEFYSTMSKRYVYSGLEKSKEGA